METSIKKLYNGLAPVRDYIVNNAILKNKNLVIVLGDKKMTVTVEELKNPLKIKRRVFKSKFNNGTYELCDFVWKEDNKNEKDLIKKEEPKENISIKTPVMESLFTVHS